LPIRTGATSELRYPTGKTVVRRFYKELVERSEKQEHTKTLRSG